MTNNEPVRPAQEQDSAGKTGFKRLLGAVTHNWGWKIGSLALAVCLWGILITMDTSLPREKVIEDVRVTVANASVLRSNGMVVVDGLDDVDTVNLLVSVPQKNYSAAAASNYTARLDLGQIQTTGEQTLKITASPSSGGNTDYGSVLAVYDADVTVSVEEYATQSQVPVEVRLTGEMPENYYGGALSRSADSVDISGPASVVEKAVRCVVEYDQSGLSPDRSPNAVNLPFYFEDAEGSVLDDSSLTVIPHGQSAAIQRITVRQDVYYLARVKVDTDALVTGEPAEGYAVSGIRVMPQTVALGGAQVAIAPYLEEDAALYTYEQVNITGQSRTVTQLLYLNTPGNVDYISNNTIQVIVTIVPEEFMDVASGSGQDAVQNP
jgi:YbbR domain-containing protein